MSQKIAGAKEEQLLYCKHLRQEIQGAIVLKSRNMSLGLLRLLVLACAMICGIYVCSTYLRQTHVEKKREYVEFQVIERPHRNNVVYQSQIGYLHYPKPETFDRFECARNPVRLFVIMSMQRSGSGWFETLLNSHVNVSSNGEIFGKKDRRQNVSSIINTLDKVYNLDLVTSSSKNECSAAIGFKWMLNQGLMEHPKEILDYFTKRGVFVIFFLRRNMLRRLVSILANSFDRDAKLLNGIHVSHVHSHEEAKTLSKYKPVLNVTSLESDLEEMKSTAIKALKYYNNTRHIIVYYEDLIKKPSKLIQIEDFLKLPRMRLNSRQVKIHKGPLSEHIDNWDEVNKTLSGTMPLKSMMKQDNSYDHKNRNDKGFHVAEKKVAFSPQGLGPTESEGRGVTKSQVTNGFRPTTPGKSPGAGHSFTEHRLDGQSKAVDNVSQIDLSTTEHGHSPGVGHSLHN
nr:sulfotransferase domain-containing protein [Tanacetum cinerariifolium]